MYNRDALIGLQVSAGAPKVETVSNVSPCAPRVHRAQCGSELALRLCDHDSFVAAAEMLLCLIFVQRLMNQATKIRSPYQFVVLGSCITEPKWKHIKSLAPSIQGRFRHRIINDHQNQYK